LVYFINKKTGYKFAGYKGLLGGDEFSFWNSEDNRVDYLDVDADDYLFPIVRRIFKSTSTNKNLCSDEIQEQVHKECIQAYEKMRIEFISEPDRMEEPDLVMEQPELPVHNYQREMNTIRELLTQTENDIVQGEREVRELSSQIANLPTMRA
jgi:ribulose bisphosphate carboxylase small subunit